jgi:hypothetical protein
MTGEGRLLSPEVDLIGQGIQDGGYLTVTAGVRGAVPRRYDDVVEAMFDIVERDFPPWAAAAARRTSLFVASALLVLGAAGLLIQRGVVSGVAAVAVAMVLVVVGVAVSSRRQAAVAGVLIWLGATYSAAGGHVLAGDSLGTALAVTAAGAGALGVGMSALLGLGSERSLALPPIMGGGLLLAIGLAMRSPLLDPGQVCSVAMVLVVIIGGAVPGWSLALARSTLSQATSLVEPSDGSVPVDAKRVAEEARAAHEVLLMASATMGVFLMVVAPISVSLGVAGTGLALCCSLIVLLQARRHRVGREVLVAVASGVGSLVTSTAVALWWHDSWRVFVVTVVVGAGSALLLWTLGVPRGSIRLSRLGDLAETVAVFALAPLLVVAAGALDAVQG